jgi:hypothetical protein
MENVIRWTLAATDPQRVPRPNVAARLAMLRTALLLTSPMARRYWKDYLGLDQADAADTAGWAIKTLTRAH